MEIYFYETEHHEKVSVSAAKRFVLLLLLSDIEMKTYCCVVLLSCTESILDTKQLPFRIRHAAAAECGT